MTTHSGYVSPLRVRGQRGKGAEGANVGEGEKRHFTLGFRVPTTCDEKNLMTTDTG